MSERISFLRDCRNPLANFQGSFGLGNVGSSQAPKDLGDGAPQIPPSVTCPLPESSLPVQSIDVIVHRPYWMQSTISGHGSNEPASWWLR